MASLFSRQTTSWGGRGLFATQSIPPGTLIHTCEAPFASVVFREFRKEVCARCFAYAFDAKRNTWNVRLDVRSGNGMWFCSDECRDEWVEEGGGGELVGQVNAAIDRVARSLQKEKGKAKEHDRTVSHPPTTDVTKQHLDEAWANADRVPKEMLDEMELEYARFILSALIRRHREQAGVVSEANSWDDMLELQDNELPYIQSRPHALASQLRVFAFVCRVVAIVPALAPSVTTPQYVRELLARDPGNVFGIYEQNRTGDSEMFGWSMYVSASFFNHDCSPNVKKQRSGRALSFYTTRDVAAGDELCTNYIDLDEPVHKRREQLARNWYFDCVCAKCRAESGEV
uniref:Protein lysine methyltransferase n=1 Tax=Mycena chlorophos TaxID=658473 RepID=A0ABQ0LY20_MYCCL|nr:protein lysine methyltransferase [Mycena chlorophos]